MTMTTDTVREAVSKRVDPALESLEQNVWEARRAMAHGRRAAGDLVDETALRVRRHPLGSVGLALATGALAGCVMGFVLGWQAGRSPAHTR
jgi:ElaB/YqjD/DUF883 family membrane-anchored ribosome-binding protein